jgi:hypothetical protein
MKPKKGEGTYLVSSLEAEQLLHDVLTSFRLHTLFIRYGGERYEKRDMQIRVRERFGALQKMDEGRVPWKFVNAAQTVEQVESDIWDIVRETMDTCVDKPVRKMWSEGNYELRRRVDDPEKEN